MSALIEYLNYDVVICVIEGGLKEVKLQVWEELVGECINFEMKKDHVIVMLRVCGCVMRITYLCSSAEGMALRKFGNKLMGQKIGILRTDIPEKSVVVRTM